MKKKHSKSHMKGQGFFQDVDAWLKKSKILSNIGGVALPVLGGLAGTSLGGPAGTAIGSAGGVAATNVLKNLGYGKMKGRGYSSKPLMVGKGVTFGLNGIIQKAPMSGKGNTTALGVVGNNYGSAKF